LKDVWGNEVRLTKERLAHLSEHPEMKEQGDKFVQTLVKPDVIIQSRSDETVRLFHRFYRGTIVGDKYLCVVVKYPRKGSAFIITTYFTDKVKTGGILWKR
jgi:hypothetical protein